MRVGVVNRTSNIDSRLSVIQMLRFLELAKGVRIIKIGLSLCDIEPLRYTLYV